MGYIVIKWCSVSFTDYRMRSRFWMEFTNIRTAYTYPDQSKLASIAVDISGPA